LLGRKGCNFSRGDQETIVIYYYASGFVYYKMNQWGLYTKCNLNNRNAVFCSEIIEFHIQNQC
jgi:hypothetical protein